MRTRGWPNRAPTPYDAIDDAIDVMLALGDCGDMLPRGDGRDDAQPSEAPARTSPLAA